MSAGANSNRDIQSLLKEKEEVLLTFGKLLHKLIRDGKISSSSCVQMSERIAQIDASVCMHSGGRVPGQSERMCPNCRVPLTVGNDAFCGDCGTNVSEFYSRNTVRCNKCRQLAGAGGAYCTVCGVKRAGG